MPEKVLVPRKDRRAQRPRSQAHGTTNTGRFQGGAVQVDTTLGQQGADVAAAVLKAAADDYARVAGLFPGVNAPQVLISIERLSPGSDGTGGAWHTTCQDATLHVDASFGSPQRTSALWIAEFAEVMMANQGQGWDCGNTNGEGLSRVIAEWAYPGALDDYETASAWLDGSRPDYVDQGVGNDTDDQSNGCAVLFIWWLVSLGYDLPAVIAAGSSTLASTYSQLTGKDGAWDAFFLAAEQQWPAGSPSGVTTDNPWSGSTPPPPPNGPPPPPPPNGPPASVVVSFAGSVGAGNYLLLPTSTLEQLARQRGLTIPQLIELAAELLALLQQVFGQGKPPAPPAAPSTSSGSSSPAAPPASARVTKGGKRP
jgi:hypothetical protein